MQISTLTETEVCRAPTQQSPAVSVVIPAYNRTATVEAAIRSVLSQTFADFELLVVDDGSSDATVATVLAMSDPRIGVLRHRVNQGPSGARNTGILASSAPLVAFQDSDDIWLPEKLSRQVAAFADPAVVASYCGMIVTGMLTSGGGQDRKPILRAAPADGYPTGQITEALLRRSLISTQTLVARRQALLDIGRFDTAFRALEDWDLALRLAQMGPIAAVPELLVVQRFSDNSLSHEQAHWAWAHRDILIKHAALLAAHPQAGALQWGIVAGRFRAIGERGQSRAAARQALRLGGWRMRPMLQYGAAFVRR